MVQSLQEDRAMMEEYLLENYGYNQPIFLQELKMDGMSANAVRQSVKRLSADGFLKRYDNGIYYIPKKGKLLDTGYLDPVQVVNCKYVSDNQKVYGYESGIGFANKLGLTTQVPSLMEVVSNKESSNGRNVKIGPQKVRVKKSAVPVTKDNAPILQFLDAVNQAEKYSELSQKDTEEILLEYARKQKFSRKQLIEVSVCMSGATAKKLVEWGIVYEFI